jgi:hypothetical protein
LIYYGDVQVGVIAERVGRITVRNLSNTPCRKGRYAPPVHIVRLTEEREIAP